MDRPEAGFYRINVRDLPGVEKRASAQAIEGAEHWFNPGWEIDELDHYKGEWAMVPAYEGWPKGWPVWIATGDLTRVPPDAIHPRALGRERAKAILRDTLTEESPDITRLA